MVKRVGVPRDPSKKKMSAAAREELLIENFIGLQKAMINLSVKFENLSDNISKLLNIFELSAKDIMMNKGRATPEVDRELMGRINMLLDQNKNLMNAVRNLDRPREMPQPAQQPQMPQGMQQSQNLQQNVQAKPKTIVQTI
jgi:hypothetical protein